MLVYSKMLLSHDKSLADENLHEKILSSINHAIGELKTLSFNLAPTAIKHFGFINGVEDYIEHLKSEHPVKIWFEYEDDKIESLDLEDKLSVFRIIQNYILILLRNTAAKTIGISISFSHESLLIKISYNNKTFIIDKTSKEFMDIEQRLEYYGGTITEHSKGDTIIIQVALKINNLMKFYSI
jgi:signal transduction histidine kinase